MLIRFTVENFLSFKDEVEFSMVAGRPRMHPDHIYRDPKRKSLRLLKTSVIYGANAAGKSNLVKAMAFARNMILRVKQPNEQIDVSSFRLDAQLEGSPSKFQFELMTGKAAFTYGFELDKEQVNSEWLYEIRPSSEILLFERKTKDDGDVMVELGRLPYTAKHSRAFMELVETSTGSNELFLSKSVQNRVPFFQGIYDWFDDRLRIIFPSPIAAGIETTFKTESEFEQESRDIIRLFDLGIDNLKLEESETFLPSSVLKNIAEQHRRVSSTVAIQIPSLNNYVFLNGDKEPLVRKFTTIHRATREERDIAFELDQESDGTQRLFELSSALLGLLSDDGDRVYVIDELDRSLHPRTTTNILTIFLANSVSRPNQLIVTTHESSLLDLGLVRRDEIWFVEKDKNGASSLYSLEEFAPRYDMNIESGYLHGRFGAIPIVPSYNILEWAR